MVIYFITQKKFWLRLKLLCMIIFYEISNNDANVTTRYKYKCTSIHIKYVHVNAFIDLLALVHVLMREILCEPQVNQHP